jgi:aldehyde:ferredoxin oxidoreductase
MKFGYNYRILRVNLSDHTSKIEEPDEIFYRIYLGGEGFVAYYLLKELEKGIDALSPKNKLIFATGPATGIALSGTGRNAVGAKSPLTNGFGEAEVGGYWGPELKRAGYDVLILEGKSKEPIYLWIHDSQVEFRDATSIWGEITGKSQEIIKSDLKDNYVHIAQIGPGGENLVRYACIINDLRNAAGRSGMGAVMGSKNLKAIAVRGKQPLNIANKAKISELRNFFNTNYLKPYKGSFAHGTGGGLIEYFANIGNLPTHNFKNGAEKTAKNIDPVIIKENVNLKMESCYACPIMCKKVVSSVDPWNIEPKYGGPEYETIAAFGSNCGIYDFKAVSKANELCNKYGIDTISTGMSISFAMECHENNILTSVESDGLDLHFGNTEAMLKMIEKIAKRDGFGKILANGVKQASKDIGRSSEQFALHVKGQEIPMHEPRLKQGLGLGYSISPTGAEHMHNLHDISLENEQGVMQFHSFGIFKPLAKDDLSPAKVRALIYQMNYRAIGNALIICYFTPWDLSEYKEIVNASTGWNTTTWELMKVGERIMNLARVFNAREGFTKEDDWLPERFFEPHSSGALSNTKISKLNLLEARSVYYEMMGWNSEGIPLKSKLEELGIDWAYNELTV